MHSTVSTSDWVRERATGKDDLLHEALVQRHLIPELEHVNLPLP